MKVGRVMRENCRDQAKRFGGCTIRQCQYLQAVQDLTDTFGYPPMFSEVMDSLTVGRINTVVKRLRDKGVLVAADRQTPRNLRLTDKGKDSLSLYRIWLKIEDGL